MSDKLSFCIEDEVAFPVIETFQKWGYCLKESICSQKELILPLKRNPNRKGNKYFHVRVISLRNVSVPLIHFCADLFYSQIEDFRMGMARMEKECNRREDLLKQEIADLQKVWIELTLS